MEGHRGYGYQIARGPVPWWKLLVIVNVSTKQFGEARKSHQYAATPPSRCRRLADSSSALFSFALALLVLPLSPASIQRDSVCRSAAPVGCRRDTMSVSTTISCHGIMKAQWSDHRAERSGGDPVAVSPLLTARGQATHLSPCAGSSGHMTPSKASRCGSRKACHRMMAPPSACSRPSASGLG